MNTPTAPQLNIYRYRRTNKSYTENLRNGVTLTLMLIPAGEIMMGAPESEPESRDNERPQHLVQLSQFLIGRYPITQSQWREVATYPQIGRELKLDPSRFKGDNLPVDNVSWEGAQEFRQRLSAKTGKNYRLPSEAQWEYGCRAGSTTPFHYGETTTSELANYQTSKSYKGSPTTESRNRTSEVGSFPANEWGLYDMHGNVWEWCEDDWHGNYDGAPTDGSAWVLSARSNTGKLLRGGSGLVNPRICRSAFRYDVTRVVIYNNVGFRVCCVPSVAESGSQRGLYS